MLTTTMCIHKHHCERSLAILFSLLFSVAVIGQERARPEISAIEKSLIRKFASPDLERGHPGLGRALDYKLDNGSVFTFAVYPDGIRWSGIKSNLKDFADQEVEIFGVYTGPSKSMNYVRLPDLQYVYLGTQKALVDDSVNFGDYVRATGKLRHIPNETPSDGFTSQIFGYVLESPHVKQHAPSTAHPFVVKLEIPTREAAKNNAK